MSTQTEMAAALPAGLYKACMLCEKNLDVEVRSVTHTYTGSCPYDGEYTQDRYEGFVTTPEIMTVHIEQHYDKQLYDEFENRRERYENVRDWFQKRANTRFEAELKETRERINGTMKPEDADLAALTVANCHYKQYAPKNPADLRAFYDELRDSLTFKALMDNAKVEFRVLPEMHPGGLKAHFECLEQRNLLNVARYRALAIFGNCAFGMPAPEFTKLLAESPRTKHYAARIAPYKSLLADKELQLHLHKYTPE